MSALWNRELSDGSGQVIDTSLIEPIFSILGPQTLQYDQLGEIEHRNGNQSSSSAPRNVYETADEQYVAISASTQPTAMRVFDAIGREDLKEDPRFADTESCLDHKDELDEIIQQWMTERSREAVLDIFDETGATVAPIYSIADILEDEQYQTLDSIITTGDVR